MNVVYEIMDAWWKDRGVNEPPKRRASDRPVGTPSHVTAKIGFAQQTGELGDLNEPVFSESGFSLGLEGAYFFNDYVGVGTEWTMASFPLNPSHVRIEDPAVDSITDEILVDANGIQSTFFVGPFFNLPLSEKWAVTARLTGGLSVGAEGGVSLRLTEEAQEDLGVSEVEVLEFDPQNSFGWSVGAGIRHLLSRNLAINLYGELNFSTHDVEYRSVEFDDATGEFVPGPVVAVDNLDMDYFAIGLSFSAMIR